MSLLATLNAFVSYLTCAVLCFLMKIPNIFLCGDIWIFLYALFHNGGFKCQRFHITEEKLAAWFTCGLMDVLADNFTGSTLYLVKIVDYYI